MIQSANHYRKEMHFNLVYVVSPISSLACYDRPTKRPGRLERKTVVAGQTSPISGFVFDRWLLPHARTQWRGNGK